MASTLRFGRAIVVSLLAAVLLVGPARTASAVVEWCEVDPLVIIVTPGGNVAAVHVTNYGLGAQNLPAVQAAKIVPSVTPVGSLPSRATDVKIYVAIPNGAGGASFATRSVVSTGPNATGTILATASGQSGQTLVLSFRLEVS
jgi:hypothetical protein